MGQTIDVQLSAPYCAPPRATLLNLCGEHGVKVYRDRERLLTDSFKSPLFWVINIEIVPDQAEWLEYLVCCTKGYFRIEGEVFNKKNAGYGQRRNGPPKAYITDACRRALIKYKENSDLEKLTATSRIRRR